jgi:hypothetical protein
LREDSQFNMKIHEFIRQILLERVEKAGALVVYDAEGRFREIVCGMADERRTVLDASGSVIEAMEKAVEWWARAGESHHPESRLLLYLPWQPPRNEEERCHDPFSGIAAGAEMFPKDDGDKFQVLCERAKPDHADKIRELFAAGVPDLTVLEAVGGGNNWPQLQTRLGMESTAEIITALLVPTPVQQDRLAENDGWAAEARELLETQLGFVPRTRSRKWEAVKTELWRFLLFSEFSNDLPQGLPNSLADIPVAKPGSETMVNRICDLLRREPCQTVYVEQADRVAQELSLEERMRDIEDLGKLDTFAFEERSFLRRYVKLMLAGEWAQATEIAVRRKESIWVKQTDRGILWTIAERAREVLVLADDIERDLSSSAKSIEELSSFYTSRAYRLDQAHREMEKGVADAYGEVEGLEELLDGARRRHCAVTEKVQSRFIDLVTKTGWPIEGNLRATNIFDRVVAPLLETRGTRVALFLVDALRYELAVALERRLSGSYTCRLHPACAQLPTTTVVGMAALLPKADGNLFLKRIGDELVPTLSGKQIRIPQERFAYVQSIYGDRVRMVDLDDLVSMTATGRKKTAPFDSVELLLVKTTEIDEQGELDATGVCMALPHILAKLIAATGKLRRFGFHHVVFATDHGFVLHSALGAGNTVRKPAGDWLELKDRCLLGSGSGGPETVLFPKEQVGISGDFTSYAAPQSFGTFSKRHPYFHEGLSLQETVIPVLEVDLGNQPIHQEEKSPVEIQLRYRGQASGTITTRRPVLEVSVFGGELFAPEIAFRLEARAKTEKGEVVVGEAASCPWVDAATGILTVKAGQAVKVPLRIIEDFTGSMEVRAVEAETGVVYGLPLKLKAEMIV